MNKHIQSKKKIEPFHTFRVPKTTQPFLGISGHAVIFISVKHNYISFFLLIFLVANRHAFHAECDGGSCLGQYNKRDGPEQPDNALHNPRRRGPEFLRWSDAGHQFQPVHWI